LFFNINVKTFIVSVWHISFTHSQTWQMYAYKPYRHKLDKCTHTNHTHSQTWEMYAYKPYTHKLDMYAYKPHTLTNLTNVCIQTNATPSPHSTTGRWFRFHPVIATPSSLTTELLEILTSN
jgi:hypothetical protein